MAVDIMFHLGQDEGFADAGAYGLSDPFPGVTLTHPMYRRLVETRMVALADAARIQDIGVPSWNDVIYGVRNVYAKTPALGVLPRNLIAAYSPSSKFGYANIGVSGAAAAVADTDVTGKTITFPSSVNTAVGRIGATGVATVDALLANGLIVGFITGIGDPTVANSGLLYVRRTDTNNWIRISRQAATNLRVEKDVATVVTTEADVTIPTTEPVTGSAIFLRLEGTSLKVYMNGTKYATIALSAGAQGLAGTLIGYDTGLPANRLGAEFEAWTVAPPYFTK